MSDVCERCGATVTLVRVGKATHKWVTNTNRPERSWRCGYDPQYPVRSHAPALEQKEEKRA